MRADDVMQRTFVRFPPRWQHVLVPEEPRGATALGTTLYTASRPTPLLLQRLLWCMARAGGGRLLLGPRETWAPPMADDAWSALWDEWTAVMGRIDGIAVYSRPQASRTGLVLALWQPERSLVVRLRRDSADLTQEVLIARALEAAPAHSFLAPRIAAQGESRGWHWLASEAMTERPHGPVLALPAGLLQEVERTVGSALSRPVNTPAHWRPAHGDLTPWNLRRAGSKTWLIDWEDAGWAPPFADEVYFEATLATMRRALRPDFSGPREEAAAYWLARVAARPRADVDADLGARLTEVLRPGG